MHSWGCYVCAGKNSGHIMLRYSMSFIRRFALWLARPTLVFYALPWLLFLLTLGTVAQRYIGLYQSERLFFGSFLLWIGPVPLPGAYFTLSFMAASLLAKLVLKSSFRVHNSGTIIAHTSVLLLLVGGLISALTREEGYITLGKDEVTQKVADYHDRALVVLKNGAEISTIPYLQLRNSQKLARPEWPFALQVKRACYPCAPKPLPAQQPKGYGLASRMELVEALPSPDDALNHAGAMIDIEGTKPEQNGTYLVLEMLSEPPQVLVGKDSYSFEMRPLTRSMPFSVQLLQFEQENHPGTTMAREYRSQVQVKDGALQWNAQISMNEPLRYRGYTIYQSSFIEGEGKTSSVLAVVRNAGWLFPYISVITLCIGLLIHLLFRVAKKSVLVPQKASSVIAVLVVLLAVFPVSGRAEGIPAFDYDSFAAIPVLHEGRMKPIDSMARALLKGMTGESRVEGVLASAWLAEVMFAPAEAAQKPLFLIKSHELKQSLGLTKAADGGRYSFNELLPVLNGQGDTLRGLAQRDPKTYSEAERELVHLSQMMTLYDNLAGSITLLVPISDITPAVVKELGLEQGESYSFYTLQKVRHTLMEKLKAVVARKSNNIDTYTPLEQDVARLAYKMDTLEKIHARNTLLRVIPGEWDNKNEWLSLWAVVEAGYGSPRSGQLFRLWGELYTAWQLKNTDQWHKASTAILDDLQAAPAVVPELIKLELYYNTFTPLYKTLFFYALAVVVATSALLFQWRWLWRATLFLLVIGLSLHGLSLAARMAILGRPPVSTLYESMLFVSFISAACGFWLSLKRKSAEGALAGSITAVCVLFLADVFAGDGDTLEMLTAVLNTNFWLGTHVVCITAGYGFSLITAAMAHIYLFRRSVTKDVDSLRNAYRLLHTLAIVSLFFTATGTMLGGIWADQSWGRFWGWDPKENGALAIVIWLVWALHGRLAGQLRETGFAAILALTTIVVALAWVGVNLLSVGLHSYGFSNAAAWGLPIFCLTELVIVAILAALCAQRRYLV